MIHQECLYKLLSPVLLCKPIISSILSSCSAQPEPRDSSGPISQESWELAISGRLLPASNPLGSLCGQGDT